MAEKFRKTWRREIVSSEGFSVRLSGKNELTYKGEQGDDSAQLRRDVIRSGRPGCHLV